MKSFLSTMIDDGNKVVGKTVDDQKGQPKVVTATGAPIGESTECDTCSGTNVVSTAGESNGDGVKLNEAQGATSKVQQTDDAEGKITVVMKAPMGAVFTEALNKRYARRPIPDNVDIGIESIFADSDTQVSANGQVIQITNKSGQAARASLLVGMLPAPTAEVTCLNTALQAMGSVKAMDFIFVDVSQLGKNPSFQPMNNTEVKVIPLERTLMPGDVPENIAIESVEMVIRYKTKS